MTREEEIKKEAYRVSYNGDEFHSFIQGAKWADENPREGMISIESACEWLKFNYTEYLNDSRMGINIEEMVEDFRKAMEE